MAWVTTVAALLAAHVLFFGDVLLGGRSLSPATYTSGLTPNGPYGAPPAEQAPHLLDVEGAAWVDEPSPYLAASAWYVMEPPLWTPGEGLGAPLAANLNSGAANPLQLPLNLWPSPRAADVYHLARLFLLALGTWTYLRALTLVPIAALLGALLTAYGGYAMAWIVHHPLSAELFLPFMLWGLERGLRGRTAGWATLALAAAGSLLGGKLQATALCFAFVGAYAAMRGRGAEGGGGRVTVAAAAGALAAGAALAGVLLLPAGELMARASGLTLGARSVLGAFLLPWPALASLATPGLFVAPGRIWPDGLPLPPGVGVAASVLAALGVAAATSPLRRVAAFLATWAAILLLRNAGAFGRDVFVLLPVVRGVFFLKYTFTAAFAVAVLAAIGLDALARGLLSWRRAACAGAGALVVAAVLAASAVALQSPPAFVEQLALPTGEALALVALAFAWRTARLRAATVAALVAVATLVEIRLLAPRRHPPRVDPYRPPAYAAFLRDAPGRLVAADGLAMPLTSAAAGLHDLRAIDVLTPGSSYAFFTRLLSFCDRVIHFTVDPDLAVAATAPALDLVAGRYVLSRGPLAFDDLETRVARQVGRERVARLFAGMRTLDPGSGALAIGAVDAGGDQRFAFTLTTPFAFEVVAESEAPELAWGTHVDGGGARVGFTIEVLATWPSGDADLAGTDLAGTEPAGTEPPGAERAVVAAAETTAGKAGVARPLTGTTGALEPGSGWRETRVALGGAPARRRLRIRITGESEDRARPARVALGDLGFSPGEAAERSLRRRRAVRHREEVAALRPVFHDRDLGVVVYENTNALPRAFRVREIEPTSSVESALTALGAGFDFRRAALVSTRDPAALAAARATLAVDAERFAPHAGDEGRAWAGADAESTVIVNDEPQVVTLATTGREPALLVLSDLSYPGWQVAVDGEPAPLLEVDGVLRGVAVPPGAHCVEYRYRPASWFYGALVSLLGAAVLGPLAVAAARAHVKIAPRARAV